MENSDTATLIHIHPKDNVGVLNKSVVAGELIAFESLRQFAETSYLLGHKFALSDIGKGDKIYKYGISIGSASCDIKAGEHVHLHNLQSDYLPTYTLEGARNFKG